LPVHVERGSTATLTLDRPERANAYTAALLDDLDAAIDAIRGEAVTCVVQSAGDGAFCGGADLDELRAATPAHGLDHRAQQVFEKLARAPFVTLCAVHGPAVAGGFELALACDLRVAGPDAWFSLPEPRLGLVPSAGGCARLVELVGGARARQIVLGGDMIDAATALAWGVVHRLVADPRAGARAWAEQIAEADPLALRLAKEILAADLGDALRRERLAEALLYGRRAT
jgi:enoyl-CoA hydratase/carnithine racemase